MDAAFVYHTELIGGIEIQKPLPKNLHAIVQMYLLILLERTLPEGHLVLPELNVICAADRIVPDVVVYREGAEFRDGDLLDSPDLAIEIASPGQTFPSLLAKCERIVATGTPVCWIMLPEKREAWIFSAASGLEQAQEDVLPVSSLGIQVSLAGLWARLDRESPRGLN